MTAIMVDIIISVCITLVNLLEHCFLIALMQGCEKLNIITVNDNGRGNDAFLMIKKFEKSKSEKELR